LIVICSSSLSSRYVACNLQKCFCPFVILRTSKLWPLEVFFDQLSHWHLLFCMEVNTTGVVVDCICCMKVMDMQKMCAFTTSDQLSACSSHVFKIVYFIPIVFTSRTSCFLFFPILAALPQKKTISFERKFLLR